jgi:hypothetical protein
LAGIGQDEPGLDELARAGFTNPSACGFTV